ncbi:MAG: hypothetical protein HQK63_10580, partial [Desulfamplus sp.]|nr:hypothetical protein [Desulfamplus sp.]
MTITKVRKRNLWLSSLIFVAALSICASINISNSFANTNIKDLDIALQYKMSEEMAKENPAFHFKKQGKSYEAERFANGLKGTVTPDGVTFTMGTAEWSLALEKVMTSDKTLQFNRTEAMQAVSMNK